MKQAEEIIRALGWENYKKRRAQGMNNVKFKVWGTKKEEPEEVFLSLQQEGDKITLMQVDEKGDRVPKGGLILSILENGTLYRYANVDVPGIKTDEGSRIVLAI